MRAEERSERFREIFDETFGPRHLRAPGKTSHNRYQDQSRQDIDAEDTQEHQEIAIQSASP